MRIVNIEKLYSYVAWPISFHPGFPNLHITAKFLGNLEIRLSDILSKIDGIDKLTLRGVNFNPCIFGTDISPVHVLELLNFPTLGIEIHDKLDDLRKDDFTPYRLHVTVPKRLWNNINTNGYELLVTLGELTLYKGLNIVE